MKEVAVGPRSGCSSCRMRMAPEPLRNSAALRPLYVSARLRALAAGAVYRGFLPFGFVVVAVGPEPLRRGVIQL